ncbi:hypothetical protein BJF92_05085 [Rhizobium rhizosphaerae]|uniref:diguanylate cyclase n=1 Tax=Xaviernesmea rhizosphaerae TaxID=1672749 RepID=A0A1Q9AF55_9HYPH|nr:hypothetical protein BJF92_05085 [Xaviernesmea rhizosphaerae]
MASAVPFCISLCSFLAPLTETCQKAVFGVAMGLSVAVLLLVGFPHRIDFLIHLPNGLIVLAAFFGGLPAIVPALIVVAGVAGAQAGTMAGLAMGQALLSGAIGIIFHCLRRRLAPTALEMAGLSCLAALTLVFCGLVEGDAGERRQAEILDPALLLFLTTFLSMAGMGREITRNRRLGEARLLRTIIDALPDNLLVSDRTGRFITANPAAATFLGRAAKDRLAQAQLADFFDGQTLRAITAHQQAVIIEHAPRLRDYPFVLKTGQAGWLSSMKAPILDDDGRLVAIISLDRDITQAKEIELQHVQTEAILREAIGCMADAMVVLDEDNRILLINQQYSALFAQTEMIIGCHIETVLRRAAPLYHAAGEDAQAFSARVLAMMRVEGRSDLTLGPDFHVSMTVRQMANGYRLVVLSDISAARAAERAMLSLNNRLEQLARIDEVTGLFNRRMLNQHLDHLLGDRDGAEPALTVMLIDVDHFKCYNDTYGHLAGDACLAAIGACLTGLAGELPLAIAARYGGEEFALVLPGIRRVAAASIADVVRRRIRDLAIPHKASVFEVVTVSIGLASGPMQGLSDAASYLSAADLALYRAKASGRDCAFTFHANMLPPPTA